MIPNSIRLTVNLSTIGRQGNLLLPANSTLPVSITSDSFRRRVQRPVNVIDI